MVRIPSEYQEVEYLDSNGTQWIDTGTVLNNGCVITIDFLIEESTDNRIVYGWRRKGTYTNSYQASIGANQSKARYVSFGVHSSIGNPSLKYGHAFEYGVKNRIVIDSENKHILVNGVVTDCNENFDNGNAFNAGGSSEYNPYLFAMNNVGTRLAMTRNTKIYAYSVKYENEFSQNFVPCYRISDSKPGMYDTVSGEFYVNSGTGEFLIGNNVYYDTINLLESRRRILLTTPHLESPTPANPLTFKSNMTTKLKEGKVYFTPVQEGEGDPSPDNVRPILGWDGIMLYRSGLNLITTDVEWLPDRWRPNKGKVVGSVYYSFYIPVPKGTVCFHKRKGFKDVVHVCLTDETPAQGINAYEIKTTTYNDDIAMDNTAGHKYMMICGSTTKPDMSVHDYCKEHDVYVGVKPWSEIQSYPKETAGLILAIPFSKTIYGGYVDLVNGEVVEEQYSFVLDGVNNKLTGGGTITGVLAEAYMFMYSMGIPEFAGSGSDYAISDKLIVQTVSSQVGLQVIRDPNGKSYVRCILDSNDLEDVSSSASTMDSVNKWLSENPVHIVYKITTPIHHTINPQVIRPLKGVNNIWSDANGNIEVKFWKH